MHIYGIYIVSLLPSTQFSLSLQTVTERLTDRTKTYPPQLIVWSMITDLPSCTEAPQLSHSTISSSSSLNVNRVHPDKSDSIDNVHLQKHAPFTNMP